MPRIAITSSMRRQCETFARALIDGNDQWIRMLPQGRLTPDEQRHIRMFRTFTGKLAECGFAAYLMQNGIEPDLTDLFTIFPGPEHADAFDFSTPGGQSIDVKAAVFQNHRSLVVPLDQLQRSPKDFYVAAKMVDPPAGMPNSYLRVHAGSFSAVDIVGYATLAQIQRLPVKNLGELDCKALPLGQTAPIEQLLAQFSHP